MVSENLNQVCMKLKENVEGRVRMIASMNSMMESYLLNLIEVSKNPSFLE